MKKLLVVMITMFMAVAVNAQSKKSLADVAEKIGLTTEQVTQLKALSKEKNIEIKAVKAKNLAKEEKKAAIKAVNKSYHPKIVKIVGKDKIKAYYAYWRKPKKN